MRSAIPATATALASLLVVSASAGAEILSTLEGDARTVAAPAALANPGAPAGTFALISAGPQRDLRDAPGVLLLLTDRGVLMAEAGDDARRFAPWRRDPENNRPLHPDAAEGSRCPTGLEDACWRPGDRVPYSAEVADAFGAGLPPIPSAAPSPKWLDRTDIPLVPLNRDPDDGYLSPPAPSVLSDEQQALLGCGAYWGTDCSLDGIDLRGADASVLVQSWTGAEGSYGAAYFPNDQTSWSYGNGLPQPGTDPKTGQCLGATSLSIPCGTNQLVNPPFLDGGFGNSANLFQSEMAALSFNMQMLLVAFSTAPAAEPDPLEPVPGSVTIDRAVLDPQNPFSRAPNQCSFTQPQYCASNQAFDSLIAAPRPSNPDRTSATHWIWEAGAEYQIVGASGDLANYAGGRVHVLGVERSRTRAVRTGVPIALFPAAGSRLSAETGFAAAASADGSEPSFGLAYLTAPEPAGAAVALAATTALAALCRIRRV